MINVHETKSQFHNDRKLQSNITHQPMNPKTTIKHRQQTNIYNDRNSGEPDLVPAHGKQTP
jgi:hypothetical protein